MLEDAKSSYIKYCESHELWQEFSKAFVRARKIESKFHEEYLVCYDSLNENVSSAKFVELREALELMKKSARKLLDLSSKSPNITKRFTIMLAHALICKFDDTIQVFEEI